jgi:hypothetical protein
VDSKPCPNRFNPDACETIDSVVVGTREGSVEVANARRLAKLKADAMLKMKRSKALQGLKRANSGTEHAKISRDAVDALSSGFPAHCEAARMH